MSARIKDPTMTVEGALEGLLKLGAAATHAGVPPTTLELVKLRASQINGCSVCVDIHSRTLGLLGEANERLFLVGTWREAPYFTDAERAALALTEAVTRMADHPDAVPDDVWHDAAQRYSEPQLSALLVALAAINAFNRLKVPTRQPSGKWVASVAKGEYERYATVTSAA